MLVGSYANDSIRNYLMEVRLLFQFHCDKNAINTDKKPHKPINHKLQSVLKSLKPKKQLMINLWRGTKRTKTTEGPVQDYPPAIGFIAWPAATTKP
jgi:hypothetical protein